MKLDIAINSDVASHGNDVDLINSKKKNPIEEESNFIIRRLDSPNTLFLDGTNYSIDEVKTPIEIFSKNATYMHNGIFQTSPPRYSMTQKDFDDEIVTVIKNQKGEVKTITIYHKSTQKSSELRAISRTMFSMYDEPDIDYNKLNGKYFYGEFKNELDQERHMHDVMATIKEEEHNASMSQRYSTCEGYKEIELAVAYESSFCNAFVNGELADSKAILLVKDVSTKYQKYPLCIKVEISHLEGYCDPQNDPYKQYVEMNQSGCNSEGLLNEVKKYWNKNRKEIHRDTMHLFSGTGLECTNNGCIVGCAYRGQICNDKEGYGINYITFTESTNLQAVLVAHELGHNCGATHEEQNNHIMTSLVNPATKGFSSTSINSIETTIKGTTCVSDAKLEPTPSPTRHPAPSVTLSPTLPPTKLPTYSPTFSTTSPTKLPTHSPTALPTYSPTYSTISPTKLPTLSSGYPTLNSLTSNPARQTLNPISNNVSTISPSRTVISIPSAENPSVGITYKPTPPFAASLMCKQSLKVFWSDFHISSKALKKILKIFEQI